MAGCLWVPGVKTQVLLSAQQIPYHRSHLPRSLKHNSFEKEYSSTCQLSWDCFHFFWAVDPHHPRATFNTEITRDWLQNIFSKPQTSLHLTVWSLAIGWVEAEDHQKSDSGWWTLNSSQVLHRRLCPRDKLYFSRVLQNSIALRDPGGKLYHCTFQNEEIASVLSHIS